MAANLKKLQDLVTKAMTGRALETSSLAPSIPQVRERLSIYADAWRMRLDESLREDYPAVLRIIGEDRWTELFADYVRAHPSASFTLMKLGDSLPTYLRAKNADPLLADLAEFENALTRVLVATDPEPWDVSHLQTLSEEEAGDLKLKLEDATHLQTTDWNVDDVRFEEAEPKRGPRRTLLISREGFEVTSEEISVDEFSFLAALRDGKTLGELADLFPDGQWVTWLAARASSGVLRIDKS